MSDPDRSYASRGAPTDHGHPAQPASERARFCLLCSKFSHIFSAPSSADSHSHCALWPGRAFWWPPPTVVSRFPSLIPSLITYTRSEAQIHSEAQFAAPPSLTFRNESSPPISPRSSIYARQTLATMNSKPHLARAGAEYVSMTGWPLLAPTPF